ncbi:MAG: DNA polymerase III subunit delta, partial [Pseudomonadales bacterium]
MKIYPDKLEAQLKKSVAPVYIVSGDEPLLVQESCDLIRSALKQSGYTERELFHIDANFDWDQVLFSANSMSLFADKKVIELRMPTGRPGDKGAVALKTYVDHPPDDTVMLVVTQRLDAAVQKTKWFKALEAMSVFVQVWPIDAKQMPRWIKERFNRAGLDISSEAVEMVVGRVEGNLLAAVQEIERLKLISESQRIEVDDVIESVADNSRYDVFSLIDTAESGDAARTHKIVQGLKSEGTEILYIVAMVSKELRNLEKMANMVARGQGVDTAIKSGGVWQKRKSLVAGSLKRHNLTACNEMQQKMGQIDKMVKGLLPGDPWTELVNVLMHLAGKPGLP